MSISGFSMVYNALDGGYPIVEAIWSVWEYVDNLYVVDMESTDGTRELLESVGVKIIDGHWGSNAGQTLADAHALHTQCDGDIILHFEADEIWSEDLIWEAIGLIGDGKTDLAVYRIQLEQNFQRCRWYPELVHRVFPKGSVIKTGHTTNRHTEARVVSADNGLLWDITNCFKKQYIQGIKNKAELWNEKPHYRYTPIHFMHPNETNNPDEILTGDHWNWKTTPFDIPDILKSLVGINEYKPEGC